MIVNKSDLYVIWFKIGQIVLCLTNSDYKDGIKMLIFNKQPVFKSLNKLFN